MQGGNRNGLGGGDSLIENENENKFQMLKFLYLKITNPSIASVPAIKITKFRTHVFFGRC